MKQLELLGCQVKDVVTGFAGVVTSISFDLYGCVGALIDPGVDKEGKAGERAWFDLKRLQRTSVNPVMPVPTFDIVPGGQSRPLPSSNPK